jgi:purine-binding chemotaxis protein CheW
LKKRKKISFKKILSRKEKEEKPQPEEEPTKKETPGQAEPLEKKETDTKKIAPPKDLTENAEKGKTPSKLEEIMIVRVGNEFYGISLANVEEIRNEIKLTQTPQLSEVLSGIAEIRDLIIPVVNLANLFGIETENKKGGKIPVIIVEISQQFVGLQVSKIVEIIEIRQNEILPLPDIFPPKLFFGGFPYKSIVVGVINTGSLLKGKQIQSFKEKIDEVIK